MPAIVRRNVQVSDPADPGKTLGDIDRIEEGILWEEKSAVDAIDPVAWAAKHIVRKFQSYLEMRNHLPGYEQAEIGFDFETLPWDDLRVEVEAAVGRLRQAHPDETIHLRFGG
jgi:hypothetical protein